MTPDSENRAPLFSPELQLMLACSRTRRRAQDRARQVALIAAGINWENFLALVEKHQIAPVVWHNLRGLGGVNLPADVLAALEQAYQINLYHVLSQAASLSHLVKQLDAEGIQYLVLKGAAVAMAYYGDASLRHSGDLDLLVGLADLPRAGQILATMGYERVPSDVPLTATQNYIHQKYLTHHVIYQHQTTHEIVELHWRLFTNPHLLAAEPFRDLQSRRIPFGALSLQSIADEDLLIYLCLHGDSHVWGRLKWQVDLLQLLEAKPVLNWPQLLIRAKEWGVARSLLLGLLLVSRLFDVMLPPAILMAIQANTLLLTRFKIVCRLFPADCFIPERMTFGELVISFRYLMGVRRGTKYQSHLWVSRCFSLKDWRTIKLPDMLFPLYIVLRPFLVMARRRRRQQVEVRS